MICSFSSSKSNFMGLYVRTYLHTYICMCALEFSVSWLTLALAQLFVIMDFTAQLLSYANEIYAIIYASHVFLFLFCYHTHMHIQMRSVSFSNFRQRCFLFVVVFGQMWSSQVSTTRSVQFPNSIKTSTWPIVELMPFTSSLLGSNDGFDVDDDVVVVVAAAATIWGVNQSVYRDI